MDQDTKKVLSTPVWFTFISTLNVPIQPAMFARLASFGSNFELGLFILTSKHVHVLQRHIPCCVVTWMICGHLFNDHVVYFNRLGRTRLYIVVGCTKKHMVLTCITKSRESRSHMRRGVWSHCANKKNVWKSLFSLILDRYMCRYWYRYLVK